MTLDAEDIEAIARRTAELVRAQSAAGVAPAEPPVTMSVDDVMRMVGANSKRTTFRALEELGVRPWRRGKYRRMDVYNAIARKSLTKRKAVAVA